MLYKLTILALVLSANIFSNAADENSLVTSAPSDTDDNSLNALDPSDTDDNNGDTPDDNNDVAEGDTPDDNDADVDGADDTDLTDDNDETDLTDSGDNAVDDADVADDTDLVDSGDEFETTDASNDSDSDGSLDSLETTNDGSDDNDSDSDDESGNSVSDEDDDGVDDGSNDTDDDDVDTDSQDVDECVGLTQNDCDSLIDDDGDRECAYNAVSSDCYGIERREGRFGSGNFDDGYSAALTNGNSQAADLKAIIGVLGAIVGILCVVIAGGVWFFYSQNDKGMRKQRVMTMEYEGTPETDSNPMRQDDDKVMLDVVEPNETGTRDPMLV